MDMDVIGSLFDASNTSDSITNSITNESVSPDDITGLLMHSFNEAEDENGIDWGITEEETDENVESDSNSDEVNDSENDSEEDKEPSEDSEDDNNEFEEDSDEQEEFDEDDNNESSENDELLGNYESIKDELDGERETLSEIYERFFKEIVEPLFRKLEDSNINVAFDTTSLKTLGVIRIELSHRNSDASAEMEINIFGNTVNGEFLGMENSDGEAVATSLDDVSLDDLINILIKVLG